MKKDFILIEEVFIKKKENLINYYIIWLSIIIMNEINVNEIFVYCMYN